MPSIPANLDAPTVAEPPAHFLADRYSFKWSAFSFRLPLFSASAVPDILDLDRALSELGTLNVRQARIVELRFFTGLSVEETAAALDVSCPTVKRDWAVAKAWMRRRLHGKQTQHA